MTLGVVFGSFRIVFAPFCRISTPFSFVWRRRRCDVVFVVAVVIDVVVAVVVAVAFAVAGVVVAVVV